jgi:hypothetical protein
MTRLVQEDEAAGKTGEAALHSSFVARSLARAGWYDRAVGVFQYAYENAPEDRPWRSRMLVEGGVAAALAGRQDGLAQILHDRRDELDRMQMTFLLEGYLRLIQGKPITVEEVEQQCVTKDYVFRVEKDILCAQIDLLSRKSTHRAQLAAHLTRAPAWRPLWILFDLYDRQEPRQDSGAFYTMAAWLYGDDPWVRRAAADYRRRVARPILPAPQKLIEDLKDYPPERWPTPRPEYAQRSHEFTERTPPGTVEAVILSLICKADYDRAEQVALRFHRLSVDMNYWVLRTHATRLIHLVEEARAAKPSPEASRR